jgi:hypothetical protein
MKKLLFVFTSLSIFACGAPALPSAVVAEETTTAAVNVEEAAANLPAAPETLLYISATMHIESKPDSWPQDVDEFIAFLEAATNAGMHWSIGADVGWLEGGERVGEIIQRASAMGVQWDVHTHEASDRAKAAYLLSKYGVTPTGVVSGMRIDEFDGLFQSLSYQGYTWTPKVVWGGVNCVGHRPGCDDTSITLYRPTSSAQYDVHNPDGALIRVGNTDHQLAAAEQLLAAINTGQYSVPVLGFTIMVEPEVLQIVNSEDSLDELLLFIEKVKQDPTVRFGTIEDTAQAWAESGGVPVLIP